MVICCNRNFRKLLTFERTGTLNASLNFALGSPPISAQDEYALEEGCKCGHSFYQHTRFRVAARVAARVVACAGAGLKLGTLLPKFPMSCLLPVIATDHFRTNGPAARLRFAIESGGRNFAGVGVFRMKSIFVTYSKVKTARVTRLRLAMWLVRSRVLAKKITCGTNRILSRDVPAARGPPPSHRNACLPSTRDTSGRGARTCARAPDAPLTTRYLCANSNFGYPECL
ncbi:hypothetical protein EVAR_91442_1 [Eumeta japonica]|uniref:Uncharacterized protein n=1 Tax=Eumeta variegata TaxID=151549 RepID=A0A4C1X140_EUMVA|nr:hypothetical protein EVAR_91442_1 [Eumeta japonica]